MIHVDRSQSTEPAILNKLYRGKTETDRAREHYEDDSWNGEAFDFKRYSEDEVKDELEKLFHKKCAYCESNFRHVSPEDVEHWRPKGSVILDDGMEQKPAYFWLAASWSNLLSSCPDCNRRRRQEDVRNPANELSGKQNLFPVFDEAHRWTVPDQSDQNGEEPVLLDPCNVDDEPVLFFTIEEDAVINEKKPANTNENKRARASIDIFGLNRKALVDVRKEHRDRILALMVDVRVSAETLKVLQAGPIADAQHDQILTKLATLKRERGDDSSYLMMKRPLIDNFMAEIGPTLVELGIV